MKKLLVLLTVVVGLFGFSAGAFAQLENVCSTCTKDGHIGSVSCALEEQETCVTHPFDFETRDGYTGETVVTEAASTHRAIFSICNCLDAGTTFVANHRIGIRLTILVNGVAGENGAYWADPNSANIRFGLYATLDEACQATAFNTQFGPGGFFKSDLTTTATPNALSSTTCVVPAAAQATVIATNVDAGYTITLSDENLKRSRWWIDIPYIRIDPNVLHNGEKISVKIETLDQATGGICATCVATCECIIDVAYVCPSSPVVLTDKCLFPYFTSTTEATPEQPYWNGIAIINTSTTPGTATLSVFQKDGATGTFTTPTIDAQSMYVEALENIPFTGSGLGGKNPIYIKVVTTFDGMDGFAMIANTVTGESMGYLCRQ
jgi:hypothetical protein